VAISEASRSESRGVEPSGALATALLDLDRLVVRRPELSSVGKTLGEVLRAAFSKPAAGIPLHPEPALIVDAWRAGLPAFRAGNSAPHVPSVDLQTRALAICEVTSRENPKAVVLSKSIRDGTANLDRWATLAIAGTLETSEIAAIDSALARSVLRLALLPALAELSERLSKLRPEFLWTRGDCPHCGGPPLLAESRGIDQRRHWRCGFCAADWRGERLRCAFCGETDHRRLHYRFVEGEQERCRLSLCESCGGGLPVVSTLGSVSAPGLLVLELETAHLDALLDDASGPER